MSHSVFATIIAIREASLITHHSSLIPHHSSLITQVLNPHPLILIYAVTLKTPMNRVLVRAFLIHCFCVALFAADAPRERMLRLATAFNTADVPRAGTQNFAVAQDERGIIYVGNLAGVLEYDGVRWRLIELPHRATPFVLVPISGGRIVVGSDGDFGYLARDEHGDMHFVSLAPLLPPSARDAGQIDRVAAASDGVVFLAGGEVLHWNGRDVVSMKSFSRDDPAWSISVIDGQAWIGTPDGLQIVTNRKLQPIAGGELFAHKRVNFVSRRTRTAERGRSARADRRHRPARRYTCRRSP